ncbi:Uncharacterized protein LI90_4145 [Carbonactinospora thermoautotrophica]|uniref:protein-serine/threonine phosphatase n=1 Tax=Carbonactinospora thermoautotrophica TaxID=1469144 RepID=A0A132MYV7_9ACTN|nr:SpoIIE family protein phosphatase [Carbonactinospora thermoautotrophica]KWX03095.1 Uncharacterized protein LI90_4145 [Carbonactinospora thermoautotrophica]
MTAFLHGQESWFPVPEVFDHAPALLAVTRGPRHILEYTNAAYVEVFGPRQTGIPVGVAFPELVSQGVIALMDEVYRTGQPHSIRSARIDYRVQGTGAWRRGYFTVVYAPLRSGQGQVEGILVFAVDVTDQVRANERLRESERRLRRTALTLQRSMLPQQVHQPDELRVATRYLPGSVEAEVGGDWYDVIPLGAGRTALVIGDVMGRGVRAAAVMGQLRSAIRAYARLDLPPHEVLHLLCGLVADMAEAQIATCVYAVFDPHEDQLQYAVAGHLPPLVVCPDGGVHRLDGASGPPLGAEGWPYHSHTEHLPSGSTVVFYTDGLVERRGGDIDDGVDRLARALENAVGDPDAVCEHLLASMRVPHSHDDDVALLVMQLPVWDGAWANVYRGAALDLLGGNEVASRARAFACGVLSSWRLPPDLQDKGVLAVSELVANALTHGSPPLKLRLRRTDKRLIVEVHDGTEHMPRLCRPALTDERGRGMSIVASISNSWGARRTPGGKAVWCEFMFPEPRA